MKTTKELIIADITAKVEAKLASQKVELSLVDDLNKVISSYTKSNANYQIAFNELKQLDDKFIALKTKAREFFAFDKKTYSEAQKVIANITKQAKDLGIDPNSIKGLKDLYQKIDDGSRSYKTYEAIEKY
jgi:DNA repair ATPase RecN